jgi:hypothetical protein
MDLPSAVNEATRSQLERVVADSFVAGFRMIMVIAAFLALGSALSAWLLIGKPEKTG